MLPPSRFSSFSHVELGSPPLRHPHRSPNKGACSKDEFNGRWDIPNISKLYLHCQYVIELQTATVGTTKLPYFHQFLLFS